MTQWLRLVPYWIFGDNPYYQLEQTFFEAAPAGSTFNTSHRAPGTELGYGAYPVCNLMQWDTRTVIYDCMIIDVYYLAICVSSFYYAKYLCSQFLFVFVFFHITHFFSCSWLLLLSRHPGSIATSGRHSVACYRLNCLFGSQLAQFQRGHHDRDQKHEPQHGPGQS